jgi:hypothetical protein
MQPIHRHPPPATTPPAHADCHKIVLQLEEKRIPYVVEKINMRCYGDKPPAFLKKVSAAWETLMDGQQQQQ